MPLCSDCMHENEQDAHFCSACGAPLGPASPAPAAERKMVTIVFSDLVGSTELGEALDPEPLRQLLSQYFAAVRRVLERHGGKVEKYIGDAVMAVFGIPLLREDDALRAMRASVEMGEELASLNQALKSRWGVQLETRTGVNTGRVVAGDTRRGETFVTGDAVNVAARLEQAAGPGQILIGLETRRLGGNAVDVEEVEPLRLKGKAGTVAAFQLKGIREGPLSTPTSTSLIGRESELQSLLDALDRSRRNSAFEAIVVWGEAGIGKSRLIEELVDRTGPDWQVLQGRCRSEDKGATFRPLGEIVQAAAGIEPEDEPDEALGKIAEMFGSARDGPDAARRIAGTIGLGEPTETADSIWAFRLLLEVLGQDDPTLVILDDLHWAEPGLLTLLLELVAGDLDGRVMLLGAARLEAREATPELADLQAVLLEPLREPEVNRLLEELSEPADSSGRIVDEIKETARGNPLFLGEYVRLLGEAETIEEGSSRGVPATIDAVLSARIAQLAAKDRSLLQFAALIGTTFWPAAVARLANATVDDAEPVLGRLIDRQLIATSDGARLAGDEPLQFSHPLLRKVTYESTLKEVRADGHLSAADWLESVAGERVGEWEEIIGHHYLSAYGYMVELGAPTELLEAARDGAVERLSAAGGRALTRGDMSAASALLKHAMALTEVGQPSHRELALKLSIALTGLGEVSKAGALLGDHIETQRVGSTHLAFRDADGHAHGFDIDTATAPVRIGRRGDNDIAIGWDQEASRHHAELRTSETGSWDIVDLGSQNGTFVNGERVEASLGLVDGDVIRIGRTNLELRCKREAPAEGDDESAVTVLRGGGPTNPPSPEPRLEAETNDPVDESVG